jgi:2-succinyl-6-hydroxy-2,4-cyclohexadiene-1-carboxylate synthase
MAPCSNLVLLHGFTHTGASWDAVIAALGDRYRPLAPDIRGHGTASQREPVDLEHVLADLKVLTPDRFALVGYSMGGRIALHAALALARQVERVVLIGASPGIADPIERAARRAADERLAAQIERSTIEEFAREWARTPVLTVLPPEIAAVVHADRLRNTPTGLARALRGLGTAALEPLWDRLGELGPPMALVVGEHDHKFVTIAYAMADRLPRATVRVVPDVGHAVHLENPPSVADIIAQAQGDR